MAANFENKDCKKSTNGNNEENLDNETEEDTEDEEEDSEESEDTEIEFKNSPRRTTRSSVAEAAKKVKKPIRRPAATAAPSSKKIATKNGKKKGPPSSGRKGTPPRKSSINCQLCSEVVADSSLDDHLSLVHFKTKLAKLLPSQPPYKCPKCASTFSDDDHDGLISHYGGHHGLNDKFVDEEIRDKVNNGGHKQSLRSLRSASRSSSSDSSVECKMCHVTLPDLASLKDHGLEVHFKEEILSSLSRTQPFSCPNPRCSTMFNDFDDLSCHFLNDHDPMAAFMTKMTSSPSNTTSNGNEDPEEDVTRPPKAWSIPKPRNYTEYCKQIKTSLRLNDGRTAEAEDDRSVKCVCGKVIRVNFRFNWRFMIQRPTLRNGQAKPKGHWFMCSEVAKVGSCVEDWKFSAAELEASKHFGCDQADFEQVSLNKRRQKRKRGPDSFYEEFDDQDEEDTKKKAKDEELDDDDDEEDESFSDEEETPREQRLIIRKRVNELMAKRVPNETFLQDGPCFQMSHEGSLMCHECKYMPLAEKRTILASETSEGEISCCFYSFRKLKSSKFGGSLSVAGFLDPLRDPTDTNLLVWQKSLSQPEFVNVEKAKFILGLIGDQFCDMVLAERKCLSMHSEIAENKLSVWKPAVKGVREMCDVCKTTIFNYHWICGRCGVFICLDCYQFRKGGLIKEQHQLTDSDRDEYNWPLCTIGESHSIRKLLLAQIIPRNELVELANKLHRLRNEHGINQFCHKPDDFSEAYSLQTLADNKSRVKSSPTLSGRPSLLYVCRLCPETAFKWQSCLYKHFLINHFNEQIRSLLPNEEPYKCPKCEYSAKQKHILMLHFGITHKVVLKLIEDAAAQGQPMFLKASAEDLQLSTSSRTSKSLIAGEISKQLDKAFNCPLCPLSISHGQKRGHLVKHFYAQLSAEVALKSSSSESTPFECYLCRHVAIDRRSLVRHVGVIHGLVDTFIKEYLPDHAEDLSYNHQLFNEPKEEISNQVTSGAECRLCERPQFFRHNGELYRHLALSHFSQRIWKEDLGDLPKDQRPFKCTSCDYTNGSSIQLIVHVGVVHRMAIKYHFETLNVKDSDWSQIETFGVPRKTNSTTTSSSSSQSQAVQQHQHKKQPSKPEKCPVCDETLALPALLFHLAQHHFSSMLAAARVPVEAPFKCPLCPHFAEQYGGILRHFFIFHKQLDVMTESLKNAQNEPKEEDLPLPPIPVIPQDFSQKGPFQCLLCDDIPPIGQTSYDFHKHLCEAHFRDRLLSAIRQIEVKEGEATVKKYACPAPNCGYELPQKWVMAKHYGLKHQIAKQFYATICDLGSLPSSQLVVQGQAEESRGPEEEFDDEHFNEQEGISKNVTQLPPVTPIPQAQILPSAHSQPLVIPHAPLPPPQSHPHQISPHLGENQYLPPPSQLHQIHVASPNPQHHAYHSHPVDYVQQPNPYVNSISDPSLDQSFASSSMDDSSMTSESPHTNSDNKSYDCQICAVKSPGMSAYLKHLSKVHFKHKLLSMVPKTSPFTCPWEGCEVTKKDRFNISLHYGMTHKVALRLMQEMPEDALNEDVEAVCKLCHESFTAHRYLYTHLSDSHFTAELDLELPASSPWKCPKCPYEGSDIRGLRVHYGVRHKVVLNFLATRLGVNANNLKKEMKAGRKKAVSALKTTLTCRFCPMLFKSPPDHAKHVVMHLRHVLAAQLPQNEPWKCPKCEFAAVNAQNLLIHYGINHPDVVKEIMAGDASQLVIDMSFIHQQPNSSANQRGAQQLSQPHGHNQQFPQRNNVASEDATLAAEANRLAMEDKRFPKCRLCNYRYFTRLDLCRHFVDYHLRMRLHNIIDPNNSRCPVCPLTYEKKQSRLRHFIWSHQDLEGLVIQDSQVRLSEFTPSLRDLEIVRQKNDIKMNPGAEMMPAVKDITDLAALPVHDNIDVKLQNSHCELCGEEFKTSVNKARDKGSHLLSHFREDIMKDLPSKRPYKCPKCTFLGKDSQDLLRHYGLNHKAVYYCLQRELGETWTLSEIDEANDCKICKQVFLNSRALTDHYCSQHFYAKLSEGLPNAPPFKCSSCSFSSKTHLALVRHMGNKHKLVNKFLQESGYERRRSSSTSQDSAHFDQYHGQQQPSFHHAQQQHQIQLQQQQWVDHYQHPHTGPPQFHHQSPPTLQQSQVSYSAPPEATSSPFASPSHHHHGFASPHHQSQLMSPPPPQHHQQLVVPHNQPQPGMATTPQPQDYPKEGSPKLSTKSDHTPVACPICNSTFLNGTHFLRHAADKHFVEQLRADLPQSPPFKCPYCSFVGKDIKLLVRHYGLLHKMVLKLLNERSGIMDSYDDSILKQYETQESNRDCCPLCKSTFGGKYMLLRHLADCHFRERLCQGLQQGEVFKCPQCNHESKDKGGFVRHYGLVHKMVQKWLKEMGISGFDDGDPKNKAIPPLSPAQHHSPTPQPQAFYSAQQINNQHYPEYPQPQAAAVDQYYPSPPPALPSVQPPGAAYMSADHQRQYPNQMPSPASQQTSPQNLSSEAYASPSTPHTYHQYEQPQQYYPQDLSRSTPSVGQQPLDYSNGQYYGIRPPSQQYGHQPLTPQTPNPAVTPQPMTPQPMTPGSHGAPTPQPMTPHDQNSNGSAGMMSPGGYNYESRQVILTPVSSTSSYYQQRPVTLQPIDAPKELPPPTTAAPNSANNRAQSNYVPPGDEFIEAPPPGMKGPYAIQCMYCQGVSKNKSDFYRHLSERHFKNDLAKELPTVAPFKCPVPDCQYETKDNTVSPLIKHYGIVHKSVQKYLRGQIAGKYVHSEAKPTNAKGVTPTPTVLEHRQQPSRPSPHMKPPTPAGAMMNGGEVTTMSNLALKVKCPFCDLMFAARYTFHQHLCDRHFKEALAEQVPQQPPYLCPVNDCGYVAKDSRQSLIRHYGMTHKVIVDLLKRHAPEYADLSDPFNQGEVQQQQPPPPPPAQQYYLPQPNQGPAYQEYYQQPDQQQLISPNEQYQQQHQYAPMQHGLPAQDLRFEPQIDGTFDPSHYSDQSSLDGFKSLPTTPVKQIKEELPSIPEPSVSATKAKGGPKICEICGKQFEGKNRAMLKVQHMAHHFKDKLFADIPDKTPPFKCPIEGCQYQTKHKPDWARHYGSVHQYIAKYLKEYLETHESKAEPLEDENGEQHEMTDEEKTYSAFLPKAELSQIISTAMDQQSQPLRNFGVITITSSDLESEHGEPGHVEPQQCFICPNGPWFKCDKDLNDHFATQHIEFVQELKPRLEVLDDLGEVLNDLDIEPQEANILNQAHPPHAPTASRVPNRSTGRPCELCGFEPKTKNKSRERQDHLAMKHYRDRIQSDLTASTNFSCPLCDYVGKDKQTIYRHYTGKHKVVEQYLAEDIAAGRVETLAQKQAYEAVVETLAQKQAQEMEVKSLAVEGTSTTVGVFSPAASEMKTLPSFETTAMELQTSGGLDLSLHAIANPESGQRISLTEFLESHDALEAGTAPSSGASVNSDRIMQVDGSISSTIMQVDGADDIIPQIDGEDEMMFPPEDELYGNDSNGSTSSNGARQIDSRCPICDFPTKLHKTYHLATKHFRDRLIALLPNDKPFKCPECGEYEAKTRINLWTHYLGKHNYSKKWINELLGHPEVVEFPQHTNHLPPPYESSPSKLQSILTQSKSLPPPPPYPIVQTPAIDAIIKPEMIKTEPSVALPHAAPTIPIEDIIKLEMIGTNEIKTEAPDTPVTSKPLLKPTETTPKTTSRVEFWCDLCQKLIKFITKTNHYASVHFEAKLRDTLPTAEPFLCIMCNHIGKDFNKLTNHFLSRHDLLDEWIREELDIIEDEAIARSGNSLFISQPDEADLIEVDSDIENENPNETSTNDLGQLISHLYPNAQGSSKRRKVHRSVQERGLEAVKDIIEPNRSKYYGCVKRSWPTNREPIPVRVMTSVMTQKLYPDVPHDWFCDGKLLMLLDPLCPGNLKLFQDQWIRGQPVLVANVTKLLNMDLWRPEAFSNEFGHIRHDIVNTKTGRKIPNLLLKKFWDGFINLGDRLTDEHGLPMLLKLKDWPPDNDLAMTLPSRFEDLMKCIPLKEYTKREGRFNLASFMPDFFVKPDLGPKMYIAYGNALYPDTGTTNLHIDMSDACNLMVHVGLPQDGIREEHISEGLKSVEEADCDPVFRSRVREENPVIGAIWHIYHPRDADKIRDLLNKVALEKGQKLEPNTDPIHDQNVFLDSKLRKRLYEEYGVVGYAFPQREGDVVFIPAGAPHQVRNIHNCIKIAEDFVSPENLEWCFYQTEEFRHLSDTHTNHEDKLQIKNILYHSVKECVNLLETVTKKRDAN